MPRARTHARNRRWQRQPLDRKPSLFERLRAQTSSEYMIMVAGVLFFALFMFLVIKGDLLPNAQRTTGTQTAQFQDEYGKPYLFYDNFDTDDSPRWNRFDPSAWRMDGKILQKYEVGYALPVLVGDSTWGQYKVSADVRVETNAATAGVIARKNEKGGFYFCGLNNNQILLYFGHESYISYSISDIGSRPYPVSTTSWHHVTLTADGTHLTCVVDDQPAVTGDVNWSPNGEVGLWGFTSRHSFDNFKVTRLPELPVFPSPSPDPVAPDLRNIQVVAGQTAATVSWTTNFPANTYVFYGVQNVREHLKFGWGWTTAHSQQLTDLLPGTTYRYFVRSCIISECTDSPQSTFTTSTGATPTPHLPQLFNYFADANDSAANITWNTDVVSSSDVSYGIGNAFEYSAETNYTSTVNHFMRIYTLNPSTTYQYFLTSCSTVDCNSSNIPLSFTTLAPPQYPTITDVEASTHCNSDGSGKKWLDFSWNTLGIPANGQVIYRRWNDAVNTTSVLQPAFTEPHAFVHLNSISCPGSIVGIPRWVYWVRSCSDTNGCDIEYGEIQ